MIFNNIHGIASDFYLTYGLFTSEIYYAITIRFKNVLCAHFLLPTNEVWGNVIISQLSVHKEVSLLNRDPSPRRQRPPRSETPPDTQYGKERAVCILLECILVAIIFTILIHLTEDNLNRVTNCRCEWTLNRNLAP